MHDDDRPVFYFDLGSPYAYLAAERVNQLFEKAIGEPPVWQPILLGGLFQRFGRSSWGEGPERDEGKAEIERRGAEYGLPPIQWPVPWPGDMLFAMRVATYAKQVGRTVAFSLAAFRQAFAAGKDLGRPDNVLVAAEACELHPRAVSASSEAYAVKRTLRRATDDAGDLGVRGVPSISIGGEIFWGDDRLDAAAEVAARAG